jgi:uncharacterized protein (DUF342 family)
VRTKGAVHARFIQNAIVEAATEVVVESGIRQSDVSAGERVVVGAPQGSISGGRTRALRGGQRGHLGAGRHRHRRAGWAESVRRRAEGELEARRRKVLDDQAKLQQLVAFFAKHPERARATSARRRAPRCTRSIATCSSSTRKSPSWPSRSSRPAMP